MKIRLKGQIQTRSNGDIFVTAVPVGVKARAGYSVLVGSQEIAKRYAAAITAGKAWTNVKIANDIYGKPYLTFDCSVRGRAASADLYKLGF